MEDAKRTNDEERRAVAGLLALDDGLASTGSLTWSPAKSKDWTHLARGGFLGAREVVDDEAPACATPPTRSPAAALVDDMSPPAEYVERTESMNWMRESIVRDLKLLEDEEDTRNHRRLLDESERCRLPPSSPVPEEVSVEHGAEHGVEHEDSDASVAATTPACARSSTSACSSHAASPDCEAMDCVVGHRKMGGSPLNPAPGDGKEWATRLGCVRTLTGGAETQHCEAGMESDGKGESGENNSFPVLRYAKAHPRAAVGAARPPVSTAAAGAVRKVQRDLPPRSLSASSQRSPEPPRSFRGSPSPTQVLPFSHDSSRGSPGSASRGDDNVIRFGSKKYVVGGRHGVAPWQERAAPNDPAQRTEADAAPVPSITESRKATVVTNVESNINMMLRLQTRGGNKGAALKAAALNTAGASSRPPSIPTSSQCANINANLGALGVGGRALSAKSLAAAGERGKLRQISLAIDPCAGEAGGTLGKATSRNFPQRDTALHRVMKRAPNGAWAASRNAPAPSAAGASTGGWR